MMMVIIKIAGIFSHRALSFKKQYTFSCLLLDGAAETFLLLTLL